MELVVHPGGQISCIYDEMIDLAALGQPTIRRASHVEPDVDGNWVADLSPRAGPVLGPFTQRSQALNAELAWLKSNWLGVPRPAS